jgi:uncharacterized membrane protein
MSLSAGLRRSFVAGLVLITPLVITLYVLRLLVAWSLQFVNPVVAGTRLTNYTGDIEIVAQVLAVVLIVGAITLLGLLARWNVGRQVFGNVGRIVNVVPLVNVIYAGVRQVADSLVERSTDYESVVLVEYPREGVYSIGLVTGESPAPVEEFAGRSVYNVFLPNSPNPTAGRLVLLPEEQVHEIDMSVRHGMRLIVTTGIGADEDRPDLPSMPERVE